jgi:hypothetical protein
MTIVTKRVWLTFTVLAGIGLLTTVVVTIISGLQYRAREDQGLQPVYAPTWIVMGTYGGLVIFVLSLIGLGIASVLVLQKRRRR